MRVAAITTLIGLANVCDQRLGVLELDLEGRKQCVLGFDREHLATHLEFQPDHIRSHGSPLGSKLSPYLERRSPETGSDHEKTKDIGCPTAQPRQLAAFQYPLKPLNPV